MVVEYGEGKHKFVLIDEFIIIRVLRAAFILTKENQLLGFSLTKSNLEVSFICCLLFMFIIYLGYIDTSNSMKGLFC